MEYYGLPCHRVSTFVKHDIILKIYGGMNLAIYGVTPTWVENLKLAFGGYRILTTIILTGHDLFLVALDADPPPCIVGPGIIVGTLKL